MEYWELICELLDHNENSDEYEVLDDLYDEFGIDLEHFEHLINKLLPLIDVGYSTLSGATYKGFGKNSMWLVKTKV